MRGLRIHRHGSVGEVLLARNAVNSLDPQLVNDLASAIAELAAESGVHALVLGSAEEKFFSAGWDLPHLLELDRAGVTAFVAAFNRLTVELAVVPLPTVAAIDGYAVAGGFILALACDFRVMTSDERRKLGLNEVDLGIPLPLPSVLLLRALAPGRIVRDVALAGRLLGPSEAHAARLVDRLAAPGRVLEAAGDLAGELAAKPSHGYGLMKAMLHRDLLSRLEREGAQAEEEFVDAFFDEDSRALLDAAARRLKTR